MGGDFVRSNVMREELQPFFDKGILPEESDIVRWRIPGNESSPEPEAGEFVIFLPALERGLGFPSNLFFRRFLHFYHIKISDLGPFFFEHLSTFQAFCKSYLGCPPFFPLWLTLYPARTFNDEINGAKGPVQACGGIVFQLCDTAKFLNLKLPSRITGNWKKKWIYVRESITEDPCPIPMFTEERSEPCYLRSVRMSKGDSSVVAMMMKRIFFLKRQGLGTGHAFNCWVHRQISPLMGRAHPLWEYSGLTDPTRHSAEDWEPAEYKSFLAKLTDFPVVDPSALSSIAQR
jgi:hypothetical protein